MSKSYLDKWAMDLVRRHCDDEVTDIKSIMRNFTKYFGTVAPDTFLKSFDTECNLYGVTKPEDKFKLLPTLLDAKSIS